MLLSAASPRAGSSTTCQGSRAPTTSPTPQLTPEKHAFSCHQAKPPSPVWSQRRALCLSCLVLLNAVPLGHCAETCGETTTQINLEHRCGGEKQLYQNENNKWPVITPLMFSLWGATRKKTKLLYFPTCLQDSLRLIKPSSPASMPGSNRKEAS